NTIARATPGKIPLDNGGVQTTPFWTQKRLPLEASTTQSSVFKSRASSAPAASAWARARICGSLLHDLSWARGSLAGNRTFAVTRRQRVGLVAPMGAGCKVIARVGRSAPRGE